MDAESTFGAYAIGNGEPYTLRCVVIGYMEDAVAAAVEYKGTYTGPLPFLAHFEPKTSEVS